MGLFNAQELVNTSWAFATNHAGEKLFGKLAMASERRLSELSTQ